MPWDCFCPQCGSAVLGDMTEDHEVMKSQWIALEGGQVECLSCHCVFIFGKGEVIINGNKKKEVTMEFNIKQDGDNVILEDVVAFECVSEENAGTFATRLGALLEGHVTSVVIPELVEVEAEEEEVERTDPELPDSPDAPDDLPQTGGGDVPGSESFGVGQDDTQQDETEKAKDV